MRGDSVRDFYAKTLALLGLGVLAGAGALVDYWPSGVRLPAVASGFDRPELALAVAVPEEGFQPQVIRTAAARPSVQRPVVEPEPEPVTLASLIPEETPLLDVAPAFDLSLMQPVALTRPAVLVPVTFAQEDSMRPLGEEVPLSEPSSTWTETTLVMSAAPVALDADDDRGLLAGVVRATKSSLVLTGRKTGASILGAFRVVSGAVKKALPN